MITRLPPKRMRPRSGILRAVPRKWPRHLRHVRSFHCSVPGCFQEPVDPAHLKANNNAGAGLKPPDWFTAPLCRPHHIEEEPIGPDEFGKRHGINLWNIAAKLAERSPDVKMRMAMREWNEEEVVDG